MKRNSPTTKIFLAVCLMAFFSKGNNQTTSTLQTPSVSPSCKDILFPKPQPSFYFEGACYFTGMTPARWQYAQLHCLRQGGSLVSIHSIEEVEFLLKFPLQGLDLGTDKVWIGLKSYSTDGSYQWVDKTAVDFTYFASNNFHDPEKCVRMNKTDGLWSNVHCKALLPFLCKRINDTVVSTTVPTTQDPSTGNCKKGWVPHHGRCYYMGGKKKEDRLNWTEAMDFCQKNGGYLTSVRNSYDQAFLTYLLQIIGADTWIGLSALFSYSFRAWVDSTKLEYTHWLISKHGTKDDCVKLWHYGSVAGGWTAAECDLKLAFICQTNKDPNLPLIPFDHEMSCTNPKGWHKLNKMCYQLFKEIPLTWREAEQSCNKEGGHLVSISDHSEEAVVAYLAGEINDRFFIGLKYDKESQAFKWLNNFPVNIAMWDKNEPSFITGDTCFASTSKGYWQKVPCDEKLPYLCQVTKVKPKITKWVGNCSFPSHLWIPGKGDYCYNMAEDLQLSSAEASRKCRAYYGCLISLHSMEESENVIKLLKPGVESIYLGLRKRHEGAYEWSDQSPVNFINWDESEPSNYNYDCVEMMTHNMKWRVNRCFDKKHFICMRVKNNSVVEELEVTKHSNDDHKLSTAIICSIIFGVLIGTALVVTAVVYTKKICNVPQLKRQGKYNSGSSLNALCEMASTSTAGSDKSKT